MSGVGSEFDFWRARLRRVLSFLRRPWKYRRWCEPALRRELRGVAPIWIVAPDVAQLFVALEIIARTRARGVRASFLLSVHFDADRQIALASPAPADRVALTPYDLALSARHAVAIVRPRCLVLLGNRLHTNLARAAHRAGQRVVWLGAECSRLDLETWTRDGLVARAALAIDLVCTADEEQRERLLTCGFEAARVRVVGSLKYDCAAPLPGAVEAARSVLRAAGCGVDRLILLGASLWPGEDAVLIDVFERLRHDFAHLALLLAPRTTLHVPQFIGAIEARGLRCVRFSRPDEKTSVSPRDDVVYLLDSVGTLKGFQALASIVFIGRSLTHRPGSNPIEAAALGRVIIAGPYMESFEKERDVLRAAGAIVEVADARDLERELRRLLADESLRSDFGARAQRAVAAERGALDRTLDVWLERLDIGTDRGHDGRPA